MPQDVDLARRHVERGREIVGLQRLLVARLRQQKSALAENAEELLDRFERSLAIFEDDLARMLSRSAI